MKEGSTLILFPRLRCMRWAWAAWAVQLSKRWARTGTAGRAAVALCDLEAKHEDAASRLPDARRPDGTSSKARSRILRTNLRVFMGGEPEYSAARALFRKDFCFWEELDEFSSCWVGALADGMPLAIVGKFQGRPRWNLGKLAGVQLSAAHTDTSSQTGKPQFRQKDL